MNCKRNQKWLHLYREGELSGRRAKSLNRHIERCPECAAVRKRIARMEATVGRIRVNAPQSEHPEMIRNRIMDAIASLPRDSRRAETSVAQNDGLNPKWKSDRFGRFALGILFHARRIRFGLAIAAAMIVLVFFVQESMILSRISRLEDRMSTVAMNPAAATPMRSGIPLTLAGIRNIPEAAVGAAAIGEEWITVRRADIETLLRSVQDSRRFNALILKIIQKQYPAIRQLDEEMFLDSEKVIRLLRENPMIIRQFLQSSETGGRT